MCSVCSQVTQVGKDGRYIGCCAVRGQSVSMETA